ncbi:hypothetical protein FJZ48_04620, partial [Candidatus Uhrbacteria bacterium]|nr:hypothetical protein [Candidatus Uhrbacteria bacterium]
MKEMQTTANQKFLRVIIVVGGCLLFLAGAILFADAFQAVQKYQKVNGEVLEILKRRCKRVNCYAP